MEASLDPRPAVSLEHGEAEARAAAERCAAAWRRGDLAEAIAAAQDALPLLEPRALDEPRRETLRLLTLAATDTGRFDIGFEAARRLVRESAGVVDPGLALNAAFALAVCFERMGDSWQAVRLLTESLERHGEGAPPRPHLVSLNAVCAILLGNWHRSCDVVPQAEAHEALMRARDHAEQALALLSLWPDPLYDVAVRGNLAEVLLHLGEPLASAGLLAEARRLAGQHGLRYHAWRLRTTAADAMLLAGDAEAALAEVESLLAEMGSGAGGAAEIRAHHTAWRAARSLRRFELALTHFEHVERLERGRAVTQLRAQSELFVTRSEAEHAQWQAEHARQEAAQQRERAAEYKRRAEQDALTGLGNRRYFERRMAELLPRLVAERQPLALAVLDIDHFKRINDAHGHAVGDRVLVALAQLLRESMRGDDVLVRMGGEEFVLALPGMCAERGAEVCERLRQRVMARAWPDLVPPRVTVSLGLALAAGARELGAGASALLQRADEALYRAKAGGRNRVEVAAGG